ncbi:MAG: SGNH/GDSL hydrolase family protein [Phycisphaerae bacterium]
MRYENPTPSEKAPSPDPPPSIIGLALARPGARRRRPTIIALTLLLVLILGGIGGEIIVRAFATTYSLDDMANASVLYRTAVFTRHRLVPDRTIVAINGDPANAIHINHRGFRGRNFEPVKPEGTTRIIFLGGSSVFSHTRGPGRDWPHRVETLLRDRGHNVECINTGVPGHDTLDSIGKFVTELWMYRPDYVVLYQGYNDQKYFDALTTDRPYRDFCRTYVPEQDLRTHAEGLDRLLCRSKLYLELRYRLLSRIFGSEGAPKKDDAVKRVDRLSPTALEQYRFNLRAICDLARDAGAVPVLCKQGRLVTPDNTPEELELLRFDFVGLTHDAWCRAFARCDGITEQVASEKNAPLIDVSAKVTGNLDYFHDHIHLTDQGEDVVAEVVAQALGEIMGQADPSTPGPLVKAR